MIEYHRVKKNRRPIGVLVAIPVNDTEVRYGYSLCNKHDVFSKDKGKTIALSRAKNIAPNSIVGEVPHTLRKHLADFSKRAAHYYQDRVVPQLVYANHELFVVS